jgi:hypothetical protein
MNEERSITDDLSDIPTKELGERLGNYFEFSGNIKRSAYLNWRFDINDSVETQFFNMGKGYFETSIALLDSCLAESINSKKDIWIFPIMFNVVHGIEVYLKGFNSIYRIYTKLQKEEYQESRIEGKHNIQQLCQLAIKMLKDSNNNELLEEMHFVKKFIDIFYDNTNDMTFARYPISSKKEKHFYVEDESSKENVTVDLDVFRQWILRVFVILDNCTSYIDYKIDQMTEWLAEMQSYYGNY